MPRGVYQRKKKHHVVEVFKPGEIPLDAVPERLNPVPKPRITQESALIGLCHRMLDQQERLLNIIESKPKARGKYKRKEKA